MTLYPDDQLLKANTIIREQREELREQAEEIERLKVERSIEPLSVDEASRVTDEYVLLRRPYYDYYANLANFADEVTRLRAELEQARRKPGTAEQ